MEQPTNLYFENVPYHITADELKALCNPHGHVKRANIPLDLESGRPRGFAFVEMMSHAEARDVIKGVDGKDVGGRTVRVTFAENRKARVSR